MISAMAWLIVVYMLIAAFVAPVLAVILLVLLRGDGQRIQPRRGSKGSHR